MIKAPRIGRLTQGTVFCGAVAEDYPSLPVWGLVITARCDTAHEKVPLVNYLPVVRLQDWLTNGGALILVDRAIEHVRNGFRALLKTRTLSENLIEVHELGDIARINFPPAAADDKSKKAERENKDCAKAAELSAQHQALRGMLSRGRVTSPELSDLTKNFEPLTSRLLRELMSHQLAGHYYLPDLGLDIEHACTHGYVVILREIHHLPRSTTKALIGGVLAEQAVPHGLNFSCFDIACPVAELTSPWVEHLMQSFSTLFTRIGVEDPDLSRVQAVLSSLQPGGASNGQ